MTSRDTGKQRTPLERSAQPPRRITKLENSVIDGSVHHRSSRTEALRIRAAALVGALVLAFAIIALNSCRFADLRGPDAADPRLDSSARSICEQLTVA